VLAAGHHQALMHHKDNPPNNLPAAQLAPQQNNPMTSTDINRHQPPSMVPALFIR
jgi:hypothetical protein